jgi:hypothetical protein
MQPKDKIPGMNGRSRFFLGLIYLAFLVCLLPVAFFTYKHPAYNFDMLGYMAVIVRMDQTKDIQQVHSITYDQARQYIPTADYEKLTSIPAFRKKFATDPTQFEKILPIYTVKPFYTSMAWLFYKAGFSLVIATVLPSILAYLLIGLFLFYWLSKYLQRGIAFLTGLLMMFSIFTVAVAGLSTPDCLSALFLLIAFYFIIEKFSLAWAFLFFLLSILARVDNVVTCFIILSFLTFSGKWKRISLRQYFWMLLMLGITYICVILPVTQFGWSILYYSQYSRHIDFSKDFNQSMSLLSYLSLVESKLVTALVSSQFTFFMLLSLLIIGHPRLSFRKLNFDQSFLLVLLGIIFFRFLLLPDLSDRFYFGFYMLILVILVKQFFTRITAIHDTR